MWDQKAIASFPYHLQSDGNLMEALPPGKCRECAIITYWIMANTFFLPDREELSDSQVGEVKVGLSVVLP